MKAGDKWAAGDGTPLVAMLPDDVPPMALCSPTSFVGNTGNWGSPKTSPSAWKLGRDQPALRAFELWAVVDEQPSPGHYTVAGIPEAWEVIEALQSAWPEDVRWHVGNVLKYVFRLGRKQGASVESDLAKIADYAQRAIKVLGKAGGK